MSRVGRRGTQEGSLWQIRVRRWCPLTRRPRNTRRKPQRENTSYDKSGTARLLSEITSLRGELRAARLRAANLEAAIRAALGANDAGEPDPLQFLRDEFDGSRGDAYGA